ncbi:MAG: PQQ-binding-like beta-propeller repeat protein, partial [Chloroflexota bacterium]
TWTAAANFVPYVQAPNTAHILWSRVVGVGGLIGGQLGDITARPDATPSPTAGSWLYPQIIYNGRCYQTLTKVVNGVTQDVWECYDLRTGQIYWDKTNSANFSATQAPTIVSYTKRAAQAVPGEEAMMRGLGVTLVYIGGGRLIKYEPFTGSTLVNVSIAPLTTGTYYSDEYVLSVQDLGAAAANATGGRYRLINWTTNDAGVAFSTGTTVTSAVNFTQRIAGNISWPISSLPSTTDYTAGVAVQIGSINPSGVSGTGVTIGQFMAGINIRTGQVMWNVSTLKKGDGSESFFSTNNCIADNGVFIARGMEGEIMGWDLYTGQLKWSTKLSYPWGEFGPYQIAVGYGLYISGSYGGVYGINETNGNIEWNFHAYTPYQFETPYQTGIGSAEYAFHVGVLIADKKLYVSAAEHTPSEPLTRGLNLYCLNVLTGQQLWNFSASQVDQSRAFTGAVADGYLAFGSEYDAVMYVFGKGQSATTVSVPQTQITTNESVIISGTVLDQSPGQPGTACVSAQSMSEWMNHLHTQGPIPTNVIGVPVSIDAVDPNNNFVNIAKVTTDMSGTFSYVWTPTITGPYKITATFAGDDSYGSSYAQTAAIVVNAPQAPATPEPIQINAATPTDVMTYSLIAAIAVIIALAIVAVLVLKRRP